MARSLSHITLGFEFDSTTITYNLNSADAKWDGDDTVSDPDVDWFSSISDLNGTWQTAFGTAMSLWDTYSALGISAVTGSTDANIYAYRTDATNDAPGRTAWFDDIASGSDYDGANITDGYERAEFFFDNSAITGYDNTAGFREYILLHESGHALGLKGDLDISGDDATLDADEYTTDMTVMSYFIPGAGFSESGGVTNYSSIGSGRFAVTPMAYDIAALVSIYGAVSANTGNNIYDQSWFSTYGLNGTNLRSMTIVDTGGTDEIDLSSFCGNHTIDLREAINGSDEWQSAATIISGNEYVYIARGSTIENATGGSGNDTIIGNSSANELDGGSGTNTVSYEHSSAAVTVNLSSGSPQSSTGDANGDTLSGFQNVIGSAYDDTLTGTSAANNIQGGDGGDTINGEAGADTLYGGNGVDLLNGGDDGDTLYGGDDGDILDGGDGVDYLYGEDGDDVLLGGAGGDHLYGGGGMNAISYLGSTGVTINLGTNSFSGGDAAGDTVSDIQNIYGSVVIDSLTGDGNANRLHGNAGGDTIDGGGGNDVIHGGTGVDILTGGTGQDTFLYLMTGDSGTTAGTRDTINDFNQGEGDLIDVGAMAGFATNAFIGTSAYSASGTQSEVRYAQVSGNTVVGMDVNGDGTGDWTIVLSGLYTLTSGDFVLT